MPVLDGDFEAFVTNLGKYNEGMLIGEWVKLPTTEEEMQKVFERIGIGKQDEFGQPYEEWFITDYECPIYGVQKMLGEYESLDKLNYLAALIDELSLSDQEKLVAIMEAGCDEVSDIDDLINLTFNLDCYDIMPGINDEYDLGYYYANEAGIYSEKDLGPLADCFRIFSPPKITGIRLRSRTKVRSVKFMSYILIFLMRLVVLRQLLQYLQVII